jgi:hypothetical protein
MLLIATLAWLGMMLLAIANGALRDILYKRRCGDLGAHQISTVALALLLVAYFRLLARFWPMTSCAQSWKIGLFWLLLTLAFEFGFGRLIAGHSWRRLLADYDVSAGRIWILIPLQVLAGPFFIMVFQ